MSTRRAIQRALTAIVLSALVAGCSAGAASPTSKGPRIVVTYSILGSIVQDLVGGAAQVTVLMPNGADPHEWSPSARDISTLMKADLLVENGLGLEGGMTKAFDQAQQAGVRRFVVADHVTVRTVGPGEGVDPSAADQQVGAPDPHLWMDPLTLRDAVAALATEIKADFGIDLAARATDLESRLTSLNDQVDTILSVVPPTQRRLVTGHESLGYFANRYSFKLIGAIVPSLSTQAESSPASLAALVATIKTEGVKAIFTELGTSPAVAQTVGSQTGAKVVEVTTHVLPADGSYFTFLTNLATVIADSLK